MIKIYLNLKMVLSNKKYNSKIKINSYRNMGKGLNDSKTTKAHPRTVTAHTSWKPGTHYRLENVPSKWLN